MLIFNVESWLCRKKDSEVRLNSEQMSGSLTLCAAMALVGYSVQIEHAIWSLNAELPRNE